VTISNDIVDRIYEAAAIPELWPEVLQVLAREVGAPAAALLAFGGDGARYTSTPNYVEALDDFVQNGSGYENQRPTRQIAGGHVGFQYDLELFTQAELDADPIYRDFITKHGFKWSAGSVILTPSSDMLVFDLTKRLADGPFARAEMERLDEYRPHLARAALLAHRLGLKAARAATEALEIIGLPAALVGGKGGVLSANPGFERLAPRVRIGALDRVSFGTPRSDGLLVEAIAQLGGPQATSVRSIPIPASGGAEALIAHLVPVRRAANDVFARAAGLLMITTVSRPELPMADVLTGLFDLTPAEARVARGVASALGVDEMAASYGLSRETVRTQLKSVMAKTGTSRQAELALLLSGASGVHARTLG
jgi:DNA-binding CsgD family transcriptional regulator